MKLSIISMSRFAKKAGKNIMFFEAKITKADGVTEYTNLRELSDLIIRGSYGVVEVCRGTDVNIMTIEKELPLGWLDSPEEGEYTFCMLDHLGQVYALLSANDDSFFPDLSEDLGIYEGYPIGSTISDGHSAIITGIIGIAAGMAIMFFIMRKKDRRDKRLNRRKVKYRNDIRNEY